MLVNLNQIFEIADQREIAIGAFNVPTLEMLRAVINAGERLQLPVILQHTEGHNQYITVEEIAPIMIQYANRASIPVCVHLDHGTTIADCVRAMDLGFTSVMYDGSSQNYEENIANTRYVVSCAKARNVSVEAELGQMLNSSIGGGEGVMHTTSDYHYTSVQEAQQFVSETDVDCLAVAVGTMHGIYLEKPVLNLKRIQEIRDVIAKPIVLHGGSGLEAESYQTAVKYGVRKINYYTYMNKCGGEALKHAIENMDAYVFFDVCVHDAEKCMAENVYSFMKILSNQ